MAKRRPPIIISNGGIASILTENLVAAPGDKRDPVEIIVDNVNKLNERINSNHPEHHDRPVARSLRGSRRMDVPMIYWRLESENENPEEIGSNAR